MSEAQTTRVLKMLKQNKPYGVANFIFPRHGILRYSARIADLRQEGYHITAERQVVNGHSTGVWFYKLVETKPKKGLFNHLKSHAA